MAINMVQLVSDQLSPIFALDTTIEAAIPRQVDAQIALQGWAISDINDRQAVYCAILSTKAMIPRLLLKFSQEVSKAEAGPAQAEFVDAIRFLEALQKEMTAQALAAAWEADPMDTMGQMMKGPRPTMAGIRAL